MPLAFFECMLFISACSLRWQPAQPANRAVYFAVIVVAVVSLRSINRSFFDDSTATHAVLSVKVYRQ